MVLFWVAFYLLDSEWLHHSLGYCAPLGLNDQSPKGAQYPKHRVKPDGYTNSKTT